MDGFEFHDSIIKRVDFSKNQLALEFDGASKFCTNTNKYEYVENNVEIVLNNFNVESMIHQGYWTQTSNTERYEVKPKLVDFSDYQQVIEKIPNCDNYIQTIEVLPKKAGNFRVHFAIGCGGAEFGYDLIVVCKGIIINYPVG